MDGMIPEGDGPFRVIAYELTHDGESWSVNTPFEIGRGLDRDGVIRRLRNRWDIFKVNYHKKARVCDIADISDEPTLSLLEVDCIPFAEVHLESEAQ